MLLCALAPLYLCLQWGLACRKMISEWGISHVLDFSRGGAANSLGRMTQRNLDGTGIQLLLAATEESDDNSADKTNVMDIKGRAKWMDLPVPASADAALDAFPQGVNWREAFGPRLLRLKDGSVALRTRYTDAFNRPPIFVSGMTPCTAEEVLCSAVINAGYSVELAGGGQHTPQLFRARIAAIAQRTKPGEGIHVNLLYLNPFLSAAPCQRVQVDAQICASARVLTCVCLSLCCVACAGGTSSSLPSVSHTHILLVVCADMGRTR